MLNISSLSDDCRCGVFWIYSHIHCCLPGGSLSLQQLENGSKVWNNSPRLVLSSHHPRLSLRVSLTFQDLILLQNNLFKDEHLRKFYPGGLRWRLLERGIYNISLIGAKDRILTLFRAVTAWLQHESHYQLLC